MEALRALMQEALAAIEKVDGVSRLIDGGADHPWNGLDAEAAYHRHT